MKRRNALKLIGGSGIIATGGYWLSPQKDNSQLSIQSTLKQLYRFNPQLINTNGQWPVSRTLEHLAQSIEFSMLGYPEMKSKAFQQTIGQLAFEVFQSRGEMTHSLHEVIPGEIISTNTSSINKALKRLIEALETFNSYNNSLKPHFAYGELTKSQYAIAHVMHINNHFEEFSFS